MIVTFQSEESPSPASEPTQVADHLCNESTLPTKKRLRSAKHTGPKEPMTAPADVEPPAKRLKVAARESARKPTAKSVENAIAKPTKQNASDKRSSLKERGERMIFGMFTPG